MVPLNFLEYYFISPLYISVLGTVLSAQLLKMRLFKEGINIPERHLRRKVRKFGYYYGRGGRRNILHEVPSNIAFRGAYIEKRFLKLDANELPRKTRSS